MRVKLTFVLLFLIIFPVFIFSQEQRPVIRFSPFYTKGIGIEESRFVETLVQSYLSEFGSVVNFFDSSMPDGSWSKAPDYVISGSIYLEAEERIFTLEFHNAGTGETLSSTTVHRTASDMVLKARTLVESLIPGKAMEKALTVNIENESLRINNPEAISERDVIGAWKGETGVEMIRLQQDGRGVAFFSSGARMNLTYTIENNTLKVRQASPNTERFYYPLPYGVAKQLSAEAGPMTWELFMYSGGTHLKGVRISTEAKVEGNMLVELMPDKETKTEWTRGR
jgi:hypothetical protein